MDQRVAIEFVVGEEKRLVDVLGRDEVMPLLGSAVHAGILQATLVDEKGVALWSRQKSQAEPERSFLLPGPGVERLPIFLEGEPVGSLCLAADGADPALVTVVGKVVAGALNSLVHANLKRMLTTEIHTQVVNQSYDDLLETNRKLTLSEQKYRQLAESLEVRVQERTEELKRAYARMIQQEKMASIGQLAAGMAHEINNPLGFVLCNLRTLEKYLGRFTEMLDFYRGALAQGEEAGALRQRGEEKWRGLKLDFISEDLGELFAQSITGGERVQKIVADLRGFSHVDDIGGGVVDINAEIERTLSVMRAEVPVGGAIRKDLEDLPAVPGDAPALCQVFFNIIRNAFQARPQGLELLIRTRRRTGVVQIEFIDNGDGIPAELQSRIFDPFFTTREVGQGVGMGLTVAYEVVHGLGGTIGVHSEVGQGTAFILRLPAGDCV